MIYTDLVFRNSLFYSYSQQFLKLFQCTTTTVNESMELIFLESVDIYRKGEIFNANKIYEMMIARDFVIAMY